VSRSWAELFGDAASSPAEEEERRGWLGRLRDSLAGSRQALTQDLLFNPADEASWERIEEALIQADVGVPATVEIVRRLEQRDPGSESELLQGLEDVVVELVGVDGDGKPTTIGKLAHRLREHERSVIVAAADTFRAAADEQLEIWAQRAGADFVGAQRGADPAAVAYDAIQAAQARGRDVVIVDTAGRLHTQTNLMEELAKIRRVIESRLEGAPHETLLVVDATTGQNGLQQARLFGEAVDVSAVALTKLDGSAKGGIAVAIAHELGLPVKLVGVGEALGDLQPFDARDFARALVSGG
jgi:fused signal recognition particle receptor